MTYLKRAITFVYLSLLNVFFIISGETRAIDRLCNGQTLLCKSIGLKVKEWDCQRLNPEIFRLNISKEISEPPKEIIQTTRLGIPKGSEE